MFTYAYFFKNFWYFIIDNEICTSYVYHIEYVPSLLCNLNIFGEWIGTRTRKSIHDMQINNETETYLPTKRRCPWGGAVAAVHSPAKHPSRSRSPSSGHGAVLIPPSFSRADPALPSKGLPVLLPPTTVDSLPFALPPSAPRSRLLFASRMVGRGWTRSHDSPSADCGGCVVRCLVRFSIFLVVVSVSTHGVRFPAKHSWRKFRVARSVGYTHGREREREREAGAAAETGRFSSSDDVITVLYRAAGESCLHSLCAASRGCITAIHTSLLSLPNLVEVIVRVIILCVIVLALFHRGASTCTNRMCARTANHEPRVRLRTAWIR